MRRAATLLARLPVARSPATPRRLLGLSLCAAMLLLAGEGVAACLGGGTGTLPAPAATFLRSYRAALGTPTRLAADAAGNVWISDPRRGSVLGRAPDGRVLARLEGLGSPVSIAVDGAGRVLVGDESAGSVTLLSAAGVPLLTLGQGPGEFGLPADIAVDQTTGEIFVSDAAADQVKVYAADGSFLRSIGEPGAGDGQFAFPTGIFVDGAGDELLVVDHLNFRVQSFDRAGAFQFCLGFRRDSTFSPRRDLNTPQGLWVDTQGRIYVADSVDGTIKVIDRQGAVLGRIGQLDPGPGQLSNPMDVVMDPFGRLYVASASGARVDVFGIDTFADPETSVPAEVDALTDPLDPWFPPPALALMIDVPGYRPADVVLATVHANGIAASEAWVGDHDADGQQELRVEFDFSALYPALREEAELVVDVDGQVGGLAFAETERVELVRYPCGDDVDNDLDGKVDLDDPGCANPTPFSREDPQCDDGRDNDGDGRIDLGDPGCQGRSWRDSEVGRRACGLHFELALVLPALLAWRRRVRARARR